MLSLRPSILRQNIPAVHVTRRAQPLPECLVPLIGGRAGPIASRGGARSGRGGEVPRLGALEDTMTSEQKIIRASNTSRPAPNSLWRTFGRRSGQEAGVEEPRAAGDRGCHRNAGDRGSGLGQRGKGENSCVLPFIEPRQQHDLAVGKFERVIRYTFLRNATR